jgi:hypothetical protein
MSRHETPMTRWYWEAVLGRGTLIEECEVAPRTADGRSAARRVDGLVLLDGPREVAPQRRADVRGRDIVVIQSKAARLGMYLMGQALFSQRLVERLGARSVRSVAVCAEDDALMRELLEAHPGL